MQQHFGSASESKSQAPLMLANSTRRSTGADRNFSTLAAARRTGRNSIFSFQSRVWLFKIYKNFFTLALSIKKRYFIIFEIN